MISSIRTRPFPVTVVAGILTLIIGIVSTAFGGEEFTTRLASWHSIQPTMAAAVSSYNVPEGLQAEGSKIKVGYQYELEKYNFSAKVKWTVDLLLNPGRAAAKRVFKVYNLSAMNSEDWTVLRKAYSKNPGLMAFIMATDDGFFGTPVKWNMQIANVMMDAFLIANESKDSNLTAVSAVAGEIVGLASHTSTAPSDLMPFYTETLFVGQRRNKAALKKATMRYANGDIDALAWMTPPIPIYVGFTEIPDDFRHNPLYELITIRGALGQPLGGVMPSWPSKDD